MLLSKENITLVNLITIQQAFGAGSTKAVKVFNALRDNDLLDEKLVFSKIKSIIGDKETNKISGVSTENIYKIIDI